MSIVTEKEYLSSLRHRSDVQSPAVQQLTRSWLSGRALNSSYFAIIRQCIIKDLIQFNPQHLVASPIGLIPSALRGLIPLTKALYL